MDPDRTITASHPLVDAAASIHAALDESDGFDPDYLSTADKQAYLRALLRASHRIQARIMRTLAGGDDVAEGTGARSAAHWIAWEEHVHPGRLVADASLARRLRDCYPATWAALAQGRISVEHARVVVEALDALPDQIPGCSTFESRTALVTRAEEHLVAQAQLFTPRELKVLGRRILEAVAPDAADAVEQALLDKEERQALRETFLELGRRGDGTTQLRGRIPDFEADILRKAFAALTSPRRGDATHSQSPDGLTSSERRGRAFCTLIRALPVDGLPTHGGSPVQIVVTIDNDKLRSGVGAATLDTGERMSATAVRRLACQHSLLPAVLDGAGAVLDLGRAKRFFGPAQRKAHLLTHQTCQAEACDIPAAWCEAHHRRGAWTDGGTTDRADLALLCAFHHHLAHDRGWGVDWSASGTARFRRRE
ncbi:MULTISPECIES: HNH endonuclease signature motif containing protein [Nocardioides]|uniref:DUF222 domain-containing protein n=1 Tax=Nocardioides vastitatis TaxID=2568655 RepID=A0ABW0ZDX5_9ACTN|nr:HNH endonuclease signature motif containing protein [Nocardioides sp.]THJ05122.1 DUF222 domain-containing protein [Nocardioides sp.]